MFEWGERTQNEPARVLLLFYAQRSGESRPLNDSNDSGYDSYAGG